MTSDIILLKKNRMNPILKEFLEYLESEDEFSYKIRMERVWDGHKYEKYISLLLRVIDSYRGTKIIPVSVVLFFTGLQHLIEQISHPNFFCNTDQPYRALVKKRKMELLELRRKFCSGELFSAS